MAKRKRSKQNESSQATDRKTGEDSRIADFKEKLADCQSFRDNYEPVWNEVYQNYRNYLEKKADETKNEYANVFIPETFNAAISEVARIVPAIATSRPIINVFPRSEREGEIATLSAFEIETLLDYEWHFPMRVVSQLVPVVLQQVLFGTTFAACFQEPKKKFPTFKFVDLLDIWLPSEASCVEDSPYLIYRTLISRAMLEERVKQGVYECDLSKLEEKQLSDTSREARLSNIGQSSTLQRGIELMHLVTDDWVTTFANKNLVIRDEKNPYRHGKKWFVMAKKFPDLDHIYGIGVGEPIKEMQEEINSLHNQRLDAIATALSFCYMADKMAAPDLKNFSFRNGGVLYMEPGSRLEPVPKPIIPQGAYLDPDILHRMICLTTGATDTMQGEQPRGFNDTAFGINALLSEGAKKFNFTLYSLAMDLLRPLAFLTHELNKQFLHEGEIIPVLGTEGTKEFLQVAKQNLKIDAEYVPSVTSLEDERPLRITLLMQFMDVLLKSGLEFNKDALIRRIARALKVSNYEEILGGDPRKKFIAEFLQKFSQAIQQAHPGASPVAAQPLPGEEEKPIEGEVMPPVAGETQGVPEQSQGAAPAVE